MLEEKSHEMQVTNSADELPGIDDLLGRIRQEIEAGNITDFIFIGISMPENPAIKPQASGFTMGRVTHGLKTLEAFTEAFNSYIGSAIERALDIALAQYQRKTLN